MVCLSLMVCYSVFDCCSTGWAEPVNSSRESHQLWTICMDFFSDQLFCVTYYWPSVTCTALVYLLDTKPWPDIWTVIVALLYALFRVIGFVEHSFFFVQGWWIGQRYSSFGLLCISFMFSCVCMHNNMDFIAIFTECIFSVLFIMTVYINTKYF